MLQQYLIINEETWLIEQVSVHEIENMQTPPGRIALAYSNPINISKYYYDFNISELKEVPPSPNPNNLYLKFLPKQQVWIDPRTVEEKWEEVIKVRNSLLTNSDWVIAYCAELNKPLPEEYLTYRQELRDITKQPSPDSIKWPYTPMILIPRYPLPAVEVL